MEMSDGVGKPAFWMVGVGFRAVISFAPSCACLNSQASSDWTLSGSLAARILPLPTMVGESIKNP
jgi:hypothetical protein